MALGYRGRVRRRLARLPRGEQPDPGTSPSDHEGTVPDGAAVRAVHAPARIDRRHNRMGGERYRKRRFALGFEAVDSDRRILRRAPHLGAYLIVALRRTRTIGIAHSSAGAH